MILTVILTCYSVFICHHKDIVCVIFTELVKNRHQKSEELMRHSASMSRAAAIETAMAHWWNGSPEGQMFSLVVASEGMFHQSGGNKQVFFGISNKKN